MRKKFGTFLKEFNKNSTQQQFGKMAGFGFNLKLVLYLQSQ
jgi:hypothetical protein